MVTGAPTSAWLPRSSRAASEATTSLAAWGMLPWLGLQKRSSASVSSITSSSTLWRVVFSRKPTGIRRPYSATKSAWPRASYCWAVMFQKSPSDLLPFCTCMVRVMDSMAPRAMVATEVKRRAVRAMASTAMRFLVRLAAKLRRVSSFSIGFMWFSPSLLLLRIAYQGKVTFSAHLWYTFVPFGSNFSPAKRAPGWGPLGREGLRPPPGRPEGG